MDKLSRSLCPLCDQKTLTLAVYPGVFPTGWLECAYGSIEKGKYLSVTYHPIRSAVCSVCGLMWWDDHKWVSVTGTIKEVPESTGPIPSVNWTLTFS